VVEKRVALVTGANKGIGFAIVRGLLEQGIVVYLGARDAARGQNAAAALSGTGPGARFLHVDVTDLASIAAAAGLIDREEGVLDILVNNAGVVVRPVLPPSQASVPEMRETYETNVFGVVAVTNAMLPLLRRAPAARIVNVSSEVGSITASTSDATPIGSMGATAQYPSSKAAVNMLTAQYAKELKGTPIKVNAANPGFTATDFTNNRGVRTAAQGAEASVHLATLPDDGPSGILYGHLWTTEGDGDGGYGRLPW
jgi:NAD(P)-dependent dehydrogenase (short-subunit alcohol dehydrogenase family)